MELKQTYLNSLDINSFPSNESIYSQLLDNSSSKLEFSKDSDDTVTVEPVDETLLEQDEPADELSDCQSNNENPSVEFELDLSSWIRSDKRQSKRYQLAFKFLQKDNSVRLARKTLTINAGHCGNGNQEDAANSVEQELSQKQTQTNPPTNDQTESIQSSTNITNSVILVNSAATLGNVDLNASNGKSEPAYSVQSQCPTVLNQDAPLNIIFSAPSDSNQQSNTVEKQYMIAKLDNIESGWANQWKVCSQYEDQLKLCKVFYFEIEPGVALDDLVSTEIENDKNKQLNLKILTTDQFEKIQQIIESQIEDLSDNDDDIDDTDQTDIKVDKIFEYEENKIPANCPVKIKLKLTLQDIRYGTILTRCLITKVFKINGKVQSCRNFRKIQIKPGTQNGMKFRFKKAGNKYPDNTPRDVVYIVKCMPHPYFERSKSCITYTALITQSEAQNGIKLDIPTVDNDFMELSLEGKDNFQETCHRFVGKGLPIYDKRSDKDLERRGDFVVQFKIVDETFKDPPIEKEFPVPLETILHGGEQTKQHNQVYIALDGNNKSRQILSTFYIKPGTKAGTLFQANRKGDLTPGKIPAEIIYTVCDQPHPTYKRINEIDLLCKYPISAEKLIQSNKLTIQKICGSSFVFTLNRNENFRNRLITEYKFNGNGLPDFDDNNRQGNLLVELEIIGNLEQQFKQENVNENHRQNHDINLHLCCCFRNIRIHIQRNFAKDMD